VNKLKVALVDDHPLVRQGLEAVLALEEGIEITGQASTAREALNMLTRYPPDVVLIDLRLPDDSGLNVIKCLKENGNDCKFIILTSSTERDDFRKAGEIGVDGYLSKEALPEEVLTAIRLVKQGRRYFDPEFVQMVMYELQGNPIEALTPRELEVLQALGRGMSNRAIAEELVVTEYTVKKHVSQILAKLDLEDRTQAALYAIEKGLVKR